MNAGFQWMPAQASGMASRIDTLFFSLLALTGTVALAIALLIVVFVIRYRRGSDADRSNPPTTARKIELAWTITPLLIFIGIFIWGAILYDNLYRAPGNAMPVFVVGKQWMWKLQHANGRREIDELHVPLGQPVRLVMSTEDVIHSFYVPAFRIKQDVVPGRYTTIWFTPTALGEFRLHCAEYCGTDHAGMGGRVIVMRPAEFQRWLTGTSGVPSMAARGFDLFRSRGCSGCHDARSTVHAPSLQGLFGRQVHLQDGRTLIADENYIRDSILQPRKDIVAGFAPIMPTFQGQLNEEELLALIAYVKSIGKEQQ
jgi:cytochrome c oxidase subunit II